MRIVIGGYEQFCTNYINALTKAGFTPIVTLSISDKNLHTFDALLLPGGGDINPIFFQQPNIASRNIDTALDVMQFTLLEQFLSTEKPILGICKGMQLINVHFGGTITQHCHYAHFHEYKNGDQIHPISDSPNSFLAKLYGTSFSVNSAHHQCIGKIGKNLSPIAYSYDNIIEAVAHDSLPVYGLQWHPERMCYAHKRDDTVDGSIIFKYCFYN